MKRIATAMLAAMLVAGAQTRDEAARLLKAAKNVELVDGDLKGAIRQYQAIAGKYAKTDRAAAAMALVRMAEAYQKMGDAESRKIFERVVREYGDQKEAVATARARLGGNSQQPASELNKLVWSSPKLGMRGRVSADGRYVSFTDWKSGDLVLREIATGVDRHLTHENYDDGNPQVRGSEVEGSAFSKDGKLIVYNWFGWDDKSSRAELRLASVNGSPNSRRLYHNLDIKWFRPADWSPDGKWVSVMVFRPDRTQQIALISVPDGALRVLKSVDWRGAGGLFFSPDGKYLAYDLPQREGRPERDVFYLSVDGSQEIHAVAHPANDTMMGWSPDGKWLLFASDRRGLTDLWGLPFAEGKPHGAPELLRANLSIAPLTEPMGVTNTGSLYYGTAHNSDRSHVELANVDFRTGKLSNTTVLAEDYLESNALAEWSPDGRQVVYKVQRGPAQKWTHEVVLIRSMDTGQVRELRPKLSYFGPMVWAADARSFLTLGGDLQGRQGIFQVDVATGNASTLFLSKPGERAWYPRWSADGKSFYFKRDYRATKDSAIIRRDLATGNETELLRRQALLCQAYPSPDDRYLPCRGIDESTNSRTLLLIPTNGGEVRELMRYSPEVPAKDLGDENKGIWFNQVLWVPDSRSMVVFKTRGAWDLADNNLETWRIPIDGGDHQKLQNDLKVSNGIARPALDPSGQRIGYTVKDAAAKRDPSIWALENVLPAKGN